MIAPEDWTAADGLVLEPNALVAAMQVNRCQALIAGPGAGKTEMLAQRADFLLRTGVSRYPKRILAISFKVDASRNLKERVLKRCGRSLAGRFDSYTFHAFAKHIIDRFRPVLTGTDALAVNYKIGKERHFPEQITFKDLVPLAVKVLQQCAAATNAIRMTYTDVFLDEFQDCTHEQYELIRLAFQGSPARMTAVGDTKQRIMGFAGAYEGVFAEFMRDFRAEPLALYMNRRSRPRLLRMQNAMIQAMDPGAVMPANQIVGDDGELNVWTFPDEVAEAQGLARAITHWILQEQVPPAEIAILFAREPHLYGEQLMAELARCEIPCRNEQELQDLSTEPVARLIVDYLSCLYGAREPKAWIRLMSQIIPFAEDEIQGDVRRGFQRFIAAERRASRGVAMLGDPYFGWWDRTKKFLQLVGLDTLTALSVEYQSKDRLKEQIGQTKARLDDLLRQDPDLLRALERFGENGAVRILTIHKCKGLEFDSVVVVGVEDETFWSKPEEERCSFFVAVSRAKRRLVLTTSGSRTKPAMANHRWNVLRRGHAEFLSYAQPFLSNRLPQGPAA